MNEDISTLVFIKNFPTRIVPSGTVPLTAGTSQLFPGESARQKRRQFVITNLDTGKIIKLRTANLVNFATVYPQTSFTIETSADIDVCNPDGAATVNIEVCELFYDQGSANVSSLAQQVASAAAGGGSSSGGGGSGSGGSGSGGGGFGFGGGGGNTQPP